MISPSLLSASLMILAWSLGSISAATAPATVDLSAADKPLLTVIERLARACSASLVVDHSVTVRMGTTVRNEIENVPWNQAKEWFATQHRLSIALEGEWLVVTDVDSAFQASLVSAAYDVRQLMGSDANRPAPDIDLPEPGAPRARSLPTLEATPATIVSTLPELIKTEIEPASWNWSGTTVVVQNGLLLVTHQQQVHTAVRSLLARLEATSARQIVVRCWSFPVTNQGKSGIVDAVTWQGQAKTLGAPRAAFILADGQRNHSYSGTERTAVVDLDVVQGIYQPVNQATLDGMALDVQAHATIGGVLATIRLAEVSGVVLTPKTVRDGQDRVISTLDTIAIEQSGQRTTRLIPSGGAAFIRIGERFWAVQCEVVGQPPR